MRYSLMKFLKVLIVCSLAFLTACAHISDGRKYGYLSIKNGRWADYIEGYEKDYWKDSFDFMMEPIVIESWACQSYFEVRDYKKFDACAKNWFLTFGDKKIPEGHEINVVPTPWSAAWRNPLNFYNIALHSMYATSLWK